MRKLILLLAVTFGINLTAQITLEKTYHFNGSASGLKLVNLTLSGYKYYLLDTTSHQIKTYNTNHSLYRSFVAPPTPSGFYLETIEHLTDNLFNTDTLIEACYAYMSYMSSIKPLYKIYNENNVLLLNIPNGYFGSVLYNISGNYKLKVAYSSGDSATIYSLPGSEPCVPCSGAVGIAINDSPDSHRMGNPYPNPTNGQATIPYTLPQGTRKGKISFFDLNGKIIKEYTVDDTFSDLIIQNNELNAGSYFYQLTTDNGIIGSKKLIVIK